MVCSFFRLPLLCYTSAWLVTVTLCLLFVVAAVYPVTCLLIIDLSTLLDKPAKYYDTALHYTIATLVLRFSLTLRSLED